ncbi:MAG: LytTR family transcriptional regulator DNA-binding domain-containing protein [Flavobacteriales bacterium]|nr:LytTR family transcriptional regulator DNA-binding domain-containing protein [Flavobacteriales bacterium]
MNWKTLQEPYPFDNSKKRAVITAVAFGSFVFLFLHFFQPFGLGNYISDKKTLQLFGYGLVTSFCLLSNHLLFSTIFSKWFNKQTWTVIKNIAYTTWVFFTIGSGNLIYSVSQHFIPFSIDGFLFYQGMTILVGIIPVIFSTLLVYHRRLESMIKQAESLNATLFHQQKVSHSELNIPSQNKSENVTVETTKLLTAKAVENYVELYSIKESELKKEIVRNTLKNIEETFSSTLHIQKCHRSYLVNLQKVKHFSGNAQGLTLNFGNEIDLSVPVSRAYVKEIKIRLQQV